MSMTPTTRLEKWLAKIAGESVDIQPKDRLETLLAKIAGESVSITPDDSLEYWLNQIAENGGSGGSSDFSTAEMTVTVDEQTTTDGLTVENIVEIDDGKAFVDTKDVAQYEVGVRTYQVLLYQGHAYIDDYGGDVVISYSGNITKDGTSYVISGDCQIVVKHLQST